MRSITSVTAILLVSGSLSLFGGTKLSKAVIEDKLQAVKACLKAGENINEHDKWGWTPLMWAVNHQYYSITEFLLANGADPNIQAGKAYKPMAKGATALVLAAYHGLDRETSVLMSAGAKVETADGNGMTALDHARKSEFTSVASLLARKGDSISKVDLGEGASAAPLSKPYSKVVLEAFTAAGQVAQEYPAEVRECQKGALEGLTAGKGFESASMKVEGPSPDGSTLLVKVEITEARIPGQGARHWRGPMVGNAFMNARVILLDGATGKVEREKYLTVHFNAWAPAGTEKSTDASLPRDLGEAIAKYLLTVRGRK